MTAISIATVLYNTRTDLVNRLVQNIYNVMEKFDQVDYYLINNSPENENLSEYLKKYDQSSKVTVIPAETNRGFGAGNNLVLKYLRSDYHFVVNPDVIIKDSEQIELMVNFMNNHPECGLLSPLMKFPNGEVQHLFKKRATVFDMALRFVRIPGFEKRRQQFVNLPDGYTSIHEAENVSGSFGSMIFGVDGELHRRHFCIKKRHITSVLQSSRRNQLKAR
ncbi:glycosyltransferase, partial [Levilactobacillus suantsaiihabitans]